MLKKILVVGAIIASSASLAETNAAPYLGGGLGILTNTSSYAANSSVTSGGVTTISGQPSNFRGVPFNVFLGYGGVINQNLYLAGEVFATLATGEIQNNYGVKTTYGYGASILPGFMLSDHTLAFARAGLVSSHFVSGNQMRTGGQLGLGLQTSVTQNVDVRGEYDFTAYHSFNNAIGRVSAPRSDAFNLSIVYKNE